MSRIGEHLRRYRQGTELVLLFKSLSRIGVRDHVGAPVSNDASPDGRIFLPVDSYRISFSPDATYSMVDTGGGPAEDIAEVGLSNGQPAIIAQIVDGEFQSLNPPVVLEPGVIHLLPLKKERLKPDSKVVEVSLQRVRKRTQ